MVLVIDTSTSMAYDTYGDGELTSAYHTYNPGEPGYPEQGLEIRETPETTRRYATPT